jgi:hypothetical protein
VPNQNKVFLYLIINEEVRVKNKGEGAFPSGSELIGTIRVLRFL